MFCYQKKWDQLFLAGPQHASKNGKKKQRDSNMPVQVIEQKKEFGNVSCQQDFDSWNYEMQVVPPTEMTFIRIDIVVIVQSHNTKV